MNRVSICGFFCKFTKVLTLFILVGSIAGFTACGSDDEDDNGIASYTITFHANGGNGTMEPQKVEENTTVTLKANTFTKAEHTFTGWSYEAEGEVAHENGTDFKMKEANVNLFAVWTPMAVVTEIIINFHANGGIGIMEPQVVLANASVVLNANTFISTMTDSVFAGWAVSEGAFASIVYLNEENITVQTSDINLFARWDQIKYKITFDLNGGVGLPSEMQNLQLAFGEQIPEFYVERMDGPGGAELEITKPGHILVGFFDAPIGGTIHWRLSVMGNEYRLARQVDTWDIRRDIVMYAQWEPI